MRSRNQLRLVYAIAVALLSAGCATSPPLADSATTATQKALLSVSAAQQYATATAQSAGRLHSSQAITDSELAEIAEAGNRLDTAWRSAAVAIAQGDPAAVVDNRVAAMQAAKLSLQIVWSKYQGRQPTRTE